MPPFDFLGRSAVRAIVAYLRSHTTLPNRAEAAIMGICFCSPPDSGRKSKAAMTVKVDPERTVRIRIPRLTVTREQP